MKIVYIRTEKAQLAIVDVEGPSGWSKMAYIEGVEYMNFGPVSLLNEHIWKQIVEPPQYGYFLNYGCSNPALKWVRTAKESGVSLLKFYGTEKMENPHIFVKV